MSDATHERETLDDGLRGEFWTLFCAHVTQEWGPAGLCYQQAVQNAAKDANAVIELQKVLHTQNAILGLMNWPAHRLSQLKSSAQPGAPSASRRGGL